MKKRKRGCLPRAWGDAVCHTIVARFGQGIVRVDVRICPQEKDDF